MVFHPPCKVIEVESADGRNEGEDDHGSTIFKRMIGVGYSLVGSKFEAATVVQSDPAETECNDGHTAGSNIGRNFGKEKCIVPIPAIM